LSPKEISSVAVVSFSLITGTTRHSSSLRERLARVQVVRARAHVEERQQHLRARDPRARAAARRRPVELALADGAGRLQLVDRAGRCARSITRMPRAIAPLVTITTSSPPVASATASQIRASTSVRSVAVVVGDDRRAELDHAASSSRRSLRPAVGRDRG
jgi:hypothetical protein